MIAAGRHRIFRDSPLLVVPILLLGLLVSCRESDGIPAFSNPPEGFPSMSVPLDNALTTERITLGRKLFFDPILSRDSNLSCGSCHRQEFAFALDEPVAMGTYGRAGVRNVPTLGNIGWHPYLMREGGVPTLEQQVAVPVQEAHEFAFSFPGIVARLKASPQYVELCMKAYDREPDAFCVTRALSAFQRTMVSADSDWDRYFLQGRPGAMSSEALRGWSVFKDLGCASCHSGFDFTDYGFHNIGLYANYADPGRFRLTGDPADVGKFKTPTLRNVLHTAPYMHDGSMATLDDVIDHFATGGHEHPNRSERMAPFRIGSAERSALKAFLASLSDPSFLKDPRFSDR